MTSRVTTSVLITLIIKVKLYKPLIKNLTAQSDCWVVKDAPSVLSTAHLLCFSLCWSRFLWWFLKKSIDWCVRRSCLREEQWMSFYSIRSRGRMCSGWLQWHTIYLSLTFVLSAFVLSQCLFRNTTRSVKLHHTYLSFIFSYSAWCGCSSLETRLQGTDGSALNDQVDKHWFTYSAPDLSGCDAVKFFLLLDYLFLFD